jgi:Cu+-exporting ATPase
LLRLAGSLERASEHPLGAAIVAAASQRGLALVDATDFYSPTGKGVQGKVEGREVRIGNARFMAEGGIDPAALTVEAEALRRDGATAIFVAIDRRAAGLLAISDPVKERLRPRSPPSMRTAFASSC